MSKLIYVEEKLFYDLYKWEKASYTAYVIGLRKIYLLKKLYSHEN